MWDRFPPRMRRMITTALEEAGRAGCSEAQTEHLLAAMAKDDACAAHFMFEEAGIAPTTLLERLQIAAADDLQAPAPERAAKLSSAAMHVLDVAVAEADRVGDRHVGTEHVALALCLTNN